MPRIQYSKKGENSDEPCMETSKKEPGVVTKLMLSVDSWTAAKKLLADGREVPGETENNWAKKLFSCPTRCLQVQHFAKIEFDARCACEIFTARIVDNLAIWRRQSVASQEQELKINDLRDYWAKRRTYMTEQEKPGDLRRESPTREYLRVLGRYLLDVIGSVVAVCVLYVAAIVTYWLPKKLPVPPEIAIVFTVIALFAFCCGAICAVIFILKRTLEFVKFLLKGKEAETEGGDCQAKEVSK